MKIEYIQYNSSNFKTIKRRKKHSFIKVLFKLLILLMFIALITYFILGKIQLFQQSHIELN